MKNSGELILFSEEQYSDSKDEDSIFLVFSSPFFSRAEITVRALKKLLSNEAIETAFSELRTDLSTAA